MNPIQSILVHLDGTARAETRVRIARELALRHKAMLTALFAVSTRFVTPAAFLGDGMPNLPLADEIDPKHRAHAKRLFEQGLRHGLPASNWHELAGDPPIQGFVQRALVSDLLVLGQRDPIDATGFDVPADFVEAVLLDSGRPAFIIPYAGDARSDPQTVLIAWKPTRESAQALAAALPFLRHARDVHVACSTDYPETTREALALVDQYLRVHGIESIHEHRDLDPHDVGNSLLSLASDIGAQLLVMGCYGHSRARELVLGGASRTVLQSMTLPVLMAH